MAVHLVIRSPANEQLKIVYVQEVVVDVMVAVLVAVFGDGLVGLTILGCMDIIWLLRLLVSINGIEHLDVIWCHNTISCFV